MTDKSSRLVAVTSPNHGEVLIDGLWRFFTTNYRVDVSIPWGDATLGAHQLIMDVFLPPDNLDRSALTDNGCNLKALLEFMYRGTVSVAEEHLEQLQSVAKQLNFQLLDDALELTKKGETQRLTRRQRKGNNPLKLVKYNEASDHESDEQTALAAKRLKPLKGKKRGRPAKEPKVDSQTTVDAATPEGIGTADDGVGNAEPPVKTKPSTVRPKKYVCDDCGFRTKAPSNLALHRRCHTGERPHKCNSCDKSFADPSTYRRHLRRHLSDERPFKCEVCSKAFRRPDNLKAHLKTGHRRVKTVHCRLCSFSSTVKGEVSQHAKVEHPEVKADKIIAPRRVFCETCGFSTETMAVLKRHQRCHTGERPFVCHVCGLAYSDRTTLRRHVHRHQSSEKSYVCEQCGNSFFRRDNLNAHLKNVHKIATPSGARSMPPAVVVEVLQEECPISIL